MFRRLARRGVEIDLAQFVSRATQSVQKLNRTPICAANGIPTVVPGPKKSPSAPAGTRNWFRLVIGRVCVHDAFRQNAVALYKLFTGVGSAARFVT